MNANELADELDKYLKGEEYDRLVWEAPTMLRQQQEQIDKLTAIVALRELNIERMIEKQSHYESMEHAAGFEAGRELGMKQERALWELAASTQEIENERTTSK